MPASLAGNTQGDLHSTVSPEQTKRHDRFLQMDVLQLTGNVGTEVSDD